MIPVPIKLRFICFYEASNFIIVKKKQKRTAHGAKVEWSKKHDRLMA